MIDEFNLLLEGKFENKRQAFRNPSKFAYIRITHVNVGDGLFYGEQAYNHNLKSPYRQFVLEPTAEVHEDKFEQIRILNYEVLEPENFKGLKNLDNLDRSMLQYKEGCDVIMQPVKKNHWSGGIGCKTCMVEWGGIETYLWNDIEMTYDMYMVEDKGINPVTNKQVWGSQYGRFEFRRMPD